MSTMRGILATGIAGAVLALAGCSGQTGNEDNNANGAADATVPASQSTAGTLEEVSAADSDAQDSAESQPGDNQPGDNAGNSPAAEAGAAGNPAAAPVPDPQAGGQCGEPDAHAAVAASVGQLAPNLEWNPDTAIADYDPCADLSWAAVTVTGATASSPYHIMLFHQGEYLGTATAEPYGFAPEITRASDRQMDVTYRWPQDGDANANPTGSSFASFAWNPVTEEIEMAGNVPPA
ncbi:LppP/LprE family lipoprotein [Corynebacterium sp. LK2522]|uniref:LppP/LprE family lipoprotein n=1 Tax=Corynebacterium sp. LK2522 TaxID=3110474 RepID=UPI0034CDDD47